MFLFLEVLRQHFVHMTHLYCIVIPYQQKFMKTIWEQVLFFFFLVDNNVLGQDRTCFVR